MKYKCLIFDHDDTVVNSTAVIHYPCFVDFLTIYRPGMTLSLEEYFLSNFDPGFLTMARETYNLSDEEIKIEEKFWKEYVKTRIPKAYPNIKVIMDAHKAAGGYIAVISHSFKDNILRDYKENGLPEPDMIFGWEQPEERRKPSVWPVMEIMKETNLKNADLLMIDDLKPGYDMAVNAGIDFAAAGWANDIPRIEQYMRNNCKYFFKTTRQLKEFLGY